MIIYIIQSSNGDHAIWKESVDSVLLRLNFDLVNPDPDNQGQVWHTWIFALSHLTVLDHDVLFFPISRLKTFYSVQYIKLDCTLIGYQEIVGTMLPSWCDYHINQEIEKSVVIDKVSGWCLTGWWEMKGHLAKWIHSHWFWYSKHQSYILLDLDWSGLPWNTLWTTLLLAMGY